MIEQISEEQYRQSEDGIVLLELYQTWEVVEAWHKDKPSGRFRLNRESTAHDVREFIAVQIAAVLGRYPTVAFVVVKNAVELGSTSFYRIAAAEWHGVSLITRLHAMERTGL